MNSLRLAQRVANLLKRRGYKPDTPRPAMEPGWSFFYVFRRLTRKSKATRIRHHEGIVGIVRVTDTGEVLFEAPEDEPALLEELYRASMP